MAATPGTPALRLVPPQRIGDPRRTDVRRAEPRAGGTRTEERRVGPRRDPGLDGAGGVARPSRAAVAAALADASRRDAAALRFLVACMCAFGLVTVLASSSVASLAQYGSPWSMFERQAMWTVLGSGVFFVAARVPLERVRRAVLPLLLVTTVLLVAVLVPHLGKTRSE
nr:FtsW/RodA/SpoVE family cell cycle protein [Actinomycetota bacterium]